MRCASPPANVPAERDRREVVEADVEQEAEAGVDLLRHPLGDQPVALAELERRRGTWPTRRSAMSQTSAMLLVVDRDRQRRRLQPRAAARRARHLAHVALVLLAAPVALGARRGGA